MNENHSAVFFLLAGGGGGCSQQQRLIDSASQQVSVTLLQLGGILGSWESNVRVNRQLDLDVWTWILPLCKGLWINSQNSTNSQDISFKVGRLQQKEEKKKKNFS